MKGLALLRLLALGMYSTEACIYMGKEFKMGETWKSVDGCNECVCGISGSICTKKMCTDVDKPTTAPMMCYMVATDGTKMAYKDGESFKSPDGCNTCMCRNGMPLCTLMACLNDKVCKDDVTGKIYTDGQSFPSADGCNKCQCLAGGIACTDMACVTTKPNECVDKEGVMHKDGDTFKAADGCNTCTCFDGKAACTEMACMKKEQCFDKYTLTLHNDGEKFDAPDGCNTCSCKMGVIACTKMICS